MNKRNINRIEKKKRTEDKIDLQAIRERASEPTCSYEKVLEDLKKDKLL